jgi:hypothetical protein
MELTILQFYFKIYRTYHFHTLQYFQGQRSAPNAVWPHPQQISASNGSLYIRPHDIMIFSNIETCDIIAKAIQRYEPLFFPPTLSMLEPPSSADNILQSLTLNIRDNPQCEQYITLNSNETCKSTILSCYKIYYLIILH